MSNAETPRAVAAERVVRRHRMRQLVREALEFHGRHKGHELDLRRDVENGNWYIRVRAPNGCYAYDGWWQESGSKSLNDAIAEALRGACLLTPN